VISDLQIPYEHPKALSFCTYLKNHYKIPDENILNVGDETDGYHAGDWPKDPDAELSPVHELSITRERLRQWGEVFPIMKLCISNHGMRWIRKATGAQIPSQIIKSYQQIFETPQGWQWREEWRFNQLKHPFRMIHGMGYSGKDGHINAAKDAQISTAIGHLHSYAGVNHVRMMGSERMWAMNTGCLIREEAVAFKYGKYSRPKPTLGCGIIFNSGSMPVWIPLE
jgi:hypothetical protein